MPPNEIKIWQSLGGVFVVLLTAATLFPLFAHRRGSELPPPEVGRLVLLSLALRSYADHHDGRLPIMHDPAQIGGALAPYYLARGSSHSAKVALMINPSTGTFFGFNSRLSEMKLKDIESSGKIYIVFYSVEPGINDGHRAAVIGQDRMQAWIGPDDWDTTLATGIVKIK